MRRAGKVFKTMVQFKTTSDDRGFTLIEVIATLIVIAILSAVAVGRISIPDDLISQADIVKSHLRFAQIKALYDDTADTAPWGIAFAGGSYTLYKNNLAAAITLPSENSNVHTFPVGVTVASGTVNFDRWGSPGTTNIPITLSQGGATTTIIVTGNTGHIAP